MRRFPKLTVRSNNRPSEGGPKASHRASQSQESLLFAPALGLLVLLAFTVPPLTVGAAESGSEASDREAPVLFEIDFTNKGDGSTVEWLQRNKFELHHHADDPRRIEFHHDDEKLNVIVKRPAFGLAIRPVEAPAARRLRLHWGVADFPEGASYEHGVDNEAIMVYVFFWRRAST